MSTHQPTVSVTLDALVIRIPWDAVATNRSGVLRRKRRFTVEDVLQLVEAGRLSHRLGKTRAVKSLEDLAD